MFTPREIDEMKLHNFINKKRRYPRIRLVDEDGKVRILPSITIKITKEESENIVGSLKLGLDYLRRCGIEKSKRQERGDWR